MVRPHLSFMVRASIVLEMAAFSTYFFDEMNVFQAHFFIDSLTHVVTVSKAVDTPVRASISTPVLPSHLTVQRPSISQTSS